MIDMIKDTLYYSGIWNPNQYEDLINEEWNRDVSEEFRGKFQNARKFYLEKTGNELGDIPNIFFSSKDDAIHDYLITHKGIDSDNIYLFRQNDALFLLGHGNNDGRIWYRGKKFSVQEVVSLLDENGLISEDISQIYILNCFGGKQKSFKTKHGIKVRSAHTSTNPILINSTRSTEDKEIMQYFFSFNDDADVDKSLKRHILKNKDVGITSVASKDEIDRALEPLMSNKPEQQVEQDAEQTLQEEPQITQENTVSSEQEIHPEQDTSQQEIPVQETHDAVDNAVEKIEEEVKDAAENVEDAGEAVEKAVENVEKTASDSAEKASKSIKMKSLSGKGKVAIGVGIALAGLGLLSLNEKNKAPEHKKEQEQQSNNFNNSQNRQYVQQYGYNDSLRTAQAISTFSYNRPYRP